MGEGKIHVEKCRREGERESKKQRERQKEKERERQNGEGEQEGEGQGLSVGDLGMLILFVCLPAMIKLF